MEFRTWWAWLTLAGAAGVVAWLGLDAWILATWAIVLLVGAVLFILGRLLARELQAAAANQRPDGGARTHRLSWWAGGVASFISCTMAAGLVRSGAPVRDFWILGALMLFGVTSLRLAYARAP